ncbi:hypothetical protein Tco_0528961 [Tanacetum coccineum]
MSVLCDLRVDVSSHLLSCAYVIEYKAEKVCHEEMVKMPLVDLKVLEVYTKSKKEHESHLKMNLELLKKEKCHMKPNKILMVGDVRTLIMEEAHATKYSVRPGVNETVARHGVHVSSIPDKDGMYIETDGQSERTFRTLENMFRACVRNLVVVGILTFREAEIGESKMIGLELEQETTKEMKLLGFSVGDHVMMKVSPWKGVVRFDKKGGLAPRLFARLIEEFGFALHRVSTARPEVSAASVPVNVSAATPSTPPTTRTIFGDEDLTIAQTLVKMRSEKAKEKEKGVVLIDEEEPPRLNRSTTTLQPLPTIDPKDKGKGVLVEEEPEKPVKVKRRDQGLAQIESDAELAQRLHEEELAELDRAQKERQKQEEATSVALAEEFDEIQARIDADHELAVRLTHEEQEKYTIEERARLRNFEEVQKLYEREKKWIDDFKPIDDDSQQQAESTKKRPRADSEEESSKKQKLEEDNDAEKEELRDSMDVVPRDDVAIDVESLATKYPIVDWKTHILNENMMYYQIIRADGSSKNYKIFSEMLDDFDRQDVIDLHRLVNERYETTSPKGYDLLLWGDLKTLFEPNKEDEIWKNQQDYNLISWRLFDSCGVHVLLMNTRVAIHMMIEKKYPLTQEMLSRMLNRRLEVDYESEMAFELLRFTRSQLQK